MTNLERQSTPELAPLDPLTGRWASQGETIATVDEPSVRIVGTDIYEWRAGGHFLEHRVHVRMGDDVVEVLEVIGEFDGSSYAMRSFDHEGPVALMRATVADAVTTFAGEVMRATAHGRRRRTVDGGALGAIRRRYDLGALDGHALHADLRPCAGKTA